MKVFKTECQPLLTVDSTLYTVDTIFITVDRDISQCAEDGYDYFILDFVPRFKIQDDTELNITLIRELDNKKVDFEFFWFWNKNLVEVRFKSEDLIKEGRYSIDISAEGETLYKGKAIRTDKDPQNFKYTINKNNKIYL